MTDEEYWDTVVTLPPVRRMVFMATHRPFDFAAFIAASVVLVYFFYQLWRAYFG